MKDVRGTVENIGGIVQDVKATVDVTLGTVDTTLVAVRQGAASTQAAVEEVVEYVKGGVAESIATVQGTFDVPAQVQQHPWPMVGGALLAGYLLGKGGGGYPSAATSPGNPQDGAVAKPGSPPASRGSSARPQPHPGIVSGMVEQVKDEMKDEIRTPSPPAQMSPDNTGRNVRDRGDATLTPGDQSERKEDVSMTQQIRQAVMADQSLSTTARNVKIITINGVVTLRGPVKSSQEKESIEAKAQHLAGMTNVDNQLEIIRP